MVKIVLFLLNSSHANICRDAVQNYLTYHQDKIFRMRTKSITCTIRIIEQIIIIYSTLYIPGLEIRILVANATMFSHLLPGFS